MSDYKLVPVEPTPEMIDAGRSQSSFPLGVYKSMITAAPAVQGEPVAYMFADEWGRTKIVLGKETAEHWAPPGETIEPLYTAPQPAEQQPAPDVAGLIGKMRMLVAAGNRLNEQAEECIYDDGMAEVAGADYWCEFRAALEAATEALAAHRKQWGGA